MRRKAEEGGEAKPPSTDDNAARRRLGAADGEQLFGRQATNVSGFEVVRRTPMSAVAAWARLTDWQRHDGFIPLTTMVVSDSLTRVGTVFTARTSLGPVGFDDPMEVTVWEPPTHDTAGLCRVEKRGRVVVGWAELRVAPTPAGCEVRWREVAGFGTTRGPLTVPTGLAGRWVFGRLVDGLLSSAP